MARNRNAASLRIQVCIESAFAGDDRQQSCTQFQLDQPIPREVQPPCLPAVCGLRDSCRISVCGSLLFLSFERFISWSKDAWKMRGSPSDTNQDVSYL